MDVLQTLDAFTRFYPQPPSYARNQIICNTVRTVGRACCSRPAPRSRAYSMNDTDEQPFHVDVSSAANSVMHAR